MLLAHNINNSIDKYRPTHKLAPKYLGPYTISAIISPTSYRLNLLLTLKIHFVFHVSVLKHYQESEEFNYKVLSQLITISESNEIEYEVKQILNKRLFLTKHNI